MLEGEGIGWLKLNRVKKLMEDENYRNLVVSRLNKALERRVGPDDHIEDVCISKGIWKGLLKLLQAMVSGLEHTFFHSKLAGMASVFFVLEIAHTHYWARDQSDIAADDVSQSTARLSTVPPGGESTVASTAACSQGSSPFGSNENLAREHGLAMLEVQQKAAAAQQRLAGSPGEEPEAGGGNKISPSSGMPQPGTAPPPSLGDQMKKSPAMQRITSIESEASEPGADVAGSDSGSITMNPAYYQSARLSTQSYRSICSDSDIGDVVSRIITFNINDSLGNPSSNFLLFITHSLLLEIKAWKTNTNPKCLEQ